MGKEIIRIQLDFLQGPIWISDVETGQPITGIDVIDNDEKLRKINYEISTLYNSYYELDSHEQACWFNEEKKKNEKEEMLALLNKLIEDISSVNDGSFEIEDNETERIKKM